MGYGACMPIDRFQISIKWPDSKGQTHDEEVAVCGTFTLRESASFTVERTQCSTSLSVLCTHPNSCTLEVKPRPMKPSIELSKWFHLCINLLVLVFVLRYNALLLVLWCWKSATEKYYPHSVERYTKFDSLWQFPVCKHSKFTTPYVCRESQGSQLRLFSLHLHPPSPPHRTVSGRCSPTPS